MAEQKMTADGRPIIWSPQPGPQTYLVTCPVEDVFFGGARGGGKGLDVLTGQILTPFGFKSVREIYVGTKVCAIDGTVTEVIGVYPQGRRPVYRCHFSDGGTVDVDDQHIWQGWRVNQTVKKKNTRTSGVNATRNYSMRELLGFVGTERDRAGYATNRLAIPVPEPVAYNVAGQLVSKGKFVSRIGLHPYVLGVLLGDGSLTGGRMAFCSADDEIPARIRGLIEPDGVLRGPYHSGTSKASNYYIKHEPSLSVLSALDVMGKYAWEKSIPRIYRMASVDERWELLRGLMDTDGWADADGDIYYTSTSRRLVDDIREVVLSLGGIASMREKTPTFTYDGEKKEGRRAYTLRIKFRDNGMAFHLPRKKAIASRKKYQSFCRYMERIERIDDSESICFQVAHHSSLFITNDFLVTHNTDGLIGDWLAHMVRNGSAARGCLFRRTFGEFGDVWSRMMELYPSTGAESNKSEYTWTWPSGARLDLRYLENDDDAARYMGRSWSWLGHDEIGQYATSSPIDKVYATLRSAAGVPCVRRSTGNPGGPGSAWIYDRYIAPSKPLVPFRWAPNSNFPDITIESVFIPSKLENNRLLMENDPRYEARLAAIGDPELYKAWRYGDWTVLSGRYFSTFKPEPPWVVPQTTLSQWFPRWIAVDWGFAHNSSVHWGCYDGTNLFVYREFVANELTPVELAQKIVELTGKHERIERVFLSPDAFARKSSVRTIADEIRQELPWPVVPADNDRIGGWSLIQQMFKFGTLRIFDSCGRLTKWLGLAQRDPKRPEDVLKTEGDDVGDSLRYLVKSTQIEPVIPPDIVMEQKLKPYLDREDYMGAFIQRMRMKEEQNKNSKPLKLKGRRR